jgi:hypothetical protein
VRGRMDEAQWVRQSGRGRAREAERKRQNGWGRVGETEWGRQSERGKVRGRVDRQSGRQRGEAEELSECHIYCQLVRSEPTLSNYRMKIWDRIRHC